MDFQKKTKSQLIEEVLQLRRKLNELEKSNTDTPEHRKTKEAFKLKEYYLSKAQEIGKIGTWDLDIKKNILVWTDENYSIFGVPAGTPLTYEIFLNCVHPDDRAFVDQEWTTRMRTNDYDIEHRLVVDGEIKWVREKAEVTFNDAGEPISAIGFTQDITLLKETERASKERIKELDGLYGLGSLTDKYDKLKDLFERFLKDIVPGSMQFPEKVIAEIRIDSKTYKNRTGKFKRFLKGEISVGGKVRGYIKVGYIDDLPFIDVFEQKLINAYAERLGKITARIESVNALQKAHDELEMRIKERTAELEQEIEERKRTEQESINYQNQLRSLASELSFTEERERRRIAIDIHDRIGQELSVFNMKLANFKSTLQTKEQQKSINEIRKQVSKLIQETRDLTFEISPPILYELGFEAALDWLVEHFQKRYDLNIHLKISKNPITMKEDLSVVLFTSVRELLMNILKHSRAGQALIIIEKKDKMIQLFIEDNGVGFDVEKILNHRKRAMGYGLFNIRERIQQYGGEFHIDSQPGKGTKANINVPI